MSDLEVGFGDSVRLNSSHIGTVSFIGYTHFKKDTLFYGINLKESKGKHNGTYDKIQYFKCSRNHGVFTEKGNIIEVIKKHSLSASFHYEQDVSIINNIGNGKLLYIGLTKYDGYQNYFYGVKLNKNLKQKYIDQIKKNPHIYYLYDNDDNHKTNEYFNADLKQSIFVRQNQLRKLDNNSNKSSMKQNSKSAAKNKQKYLKIRQQNGGVRRSMSMQPRKKTKNRAKMKSKKPSTPTSSASPPSIPSTPSSSSSKKKASTSSQKTASLTTKNSKKKTNSEKEKNKNKSNNDTSNNDKSLAKRKKIREMRMSNAIQSDLGAIQKAKARRKAKLKAKSKANSKSKQSTSPKSGKTPKIVIPNSKQNEIKFNGCSTPTKPNKSKSKSKSKSKTNNKKKGKTKPMHRPTLSKANSASYVASEKQKKKKAIAEKKKAYQTAAIKQKPKKNATKSSKKKKINKTKSAHTRKRSLSSNSSSNRKATPMNSMSRSVSSTNASKKKGNSNNNKKGKSKKKKRKRYTVDDTHIINKQKNNKNKRKFHVIHEDEEDDDDMLSYHDIINDKEKFIKYIDNKNFYYHRQFMKNNEEDMMEKNMAMQKQQIVSQIKGRKPPPSMVSFFSSKSRVNQRKKRALPSAPKTYTITIRTRPLGFFIETRKLNTIIQDKESGEHKSEQVEVVDNKNKFNKVNAYISSIASEEWQSILIVGSQLLSINDESITGLSFSKIFQQLSQQKLPFDLKLAAPRDHDINMDELSINNSSSNNLPALSMNFTSNESDVSSINSEITSPSLSIYSPDSTNSNNNEDINGYDTSSTNSWNGISDIPRGRGQTIDETKLSKQTDKKKNKFRFRLF